jgi:alanine dehydrogenase
MLRQRRTVRTIGLPRLHKEAGERRDFLPRLLQFLGQFGLKRIALERGYGSGLGYSDADYLAASDAACFTSIDECFAQELVVVLRWPDEDLIRSMRPGSILVTMAHFTTRPGRVALLKKLGLRCVSLDCLQDDLGGRLGVNGRAVAPHGVGAAFEQLQSLMPGFEGPRRRPVRVTLMGAGAVGGHAAQAAARYGDETLQQKLAKQQLPGVEVTLVDYDLTCQEAYMLALLVQTDLLIDATQRADASQIIVPNDWIALLPEHAVLLDLCVDPYLFHQSPAQVKGIEGMPEGNLDQYVFPPDDPGWDRLPPEVRREHRRMALSCYSWPGVDPVGCMQVYGRQLEPVLRVILTREVTQLDSEPGTEIERAVARAELSRYG